MKPFTETQTLRTPKIIIPRIPFRTRTDRQKPNKPGRREDFFGSAHVTQITGFRTKKKDIDYGDIKTAKLVRRDIAMTEKKRSVFGGGSKSRKFTF